MNAKLTALLAELTAHPLLEGDFRLTQGATDRSDELSELRFDNPVTVPYLDVRRATEAVRSGGAVLWVRTAVARKRLGEGVPGMASWRGRWLLLAAREAHVRVHSPRRAIGLLTVHSGHVAASTAGPLPAHLGHVIDVRVTSDELVAEVDHVLERHQETYLGLETLADRAAVPEHWHLREPAEIARLLLDSVQAGNTD